MPTGNYTNYSEEYIKLRKYLYKLYEMIVGNPLMVYYMSDEELLESLVKGVRLMKYTIIALALCLAVAIITFVVAL